MRIVVLVLSTEVLVDEPKKTHSALLNLQGPLCKTVKKTVKTPCAQGCLFSMLAITVLCLDSTRNVSFLVFHLNKNNNNNKHANRVLRISPLLGHPKESHHVFDRVSLVNQPSIIFLLSGAPRRSPAFVSSTGNYVYKQFVAVAD